MANILKQIKVGNTTYNIEPVTAYLPLSGGTMTGPIYYQGTKAKYGMIKWIDNTADTYGNGIRIGGGGATIIGGGESADLPSLSGGDEVLYLMNDGAIDFYSNCQEGLNSAQHMTFDVYGTLNVPTNVVGSSNSNRLIFRHLDGQNCNGNYDLYLQYHQRNTKIYLNGTDYYIENGSYYNGTAAAANSVAWGNVSGKPSSFNPASHTHTSLKSNTDNRNTNTTPNDYNGVLNIAGLKGNDKIGLDTNTYGTYSCLIGVRGWQDSSGGDSHEIALTGNGQIMHRSGSTTSWGGWDKIAHTSYIDTYFPRAKFGNDSYYSDVSTSFIGGVYNGPRTNDWEFLYRAEHRNGAGDGPNYVMEMVSNLTSDSSIYWRKKTGGSFTSFREIIDSNNIGSQNVNYANSAGSANSVAWGNISNKPFKGTSFVSGDSDNGEHNANNTIENGHYYYTSNGPATSLGASTSDGALYVQSYSSSWVGQIAQDYRNGSLFVRGKNNGSWSSWKRIIDSDNIGSQSVNYSTSSHLLRTYNSGDGSHGADYYLKCKHNVDGDGRFKLQIIRNDGSVTHSTSVDYAKLAGAAGSVAWGNIGGKPSTFPPDSHTHSQFSSMVGFDHKYYAYGDNGSWRLNEYDSVGNTLDIRYGKININAQEKTYSVSFGANNSFNNTNYAIVFGIYRDNRNSWFWSPLVKSRSNTGFTVYVRGNTSGDNSGTLLYIAIRSN